MENHQQSVAARNNFRALAAAAMALSVAMAFAVATPATAQSGPICSKFDSGTDGFGPCTDAPNVTVTTSTNNGIVKDDSYLLVTDKSGASRVCSSDPKFVGNWLEKMNGCGQLCFDFKVISSGYPPSPITPSISIVGPGGSRATFHASFQIAIGDQSWHQKICAPIIDGASAPPGWTITGSATWNQIITSVSMVQLPIDFTSQPSEQVGYDNICMTPGNCGDKKPPEITGCLKDSKVEVTCNKDGAYTVTLTGAGAPGDMMSLGSQTSGVTVSPPQQPWAATTSWTVSGGSPGQSIVLTANATKQGGGGAQGTDQCCSGEIKITLPECPKDDQIDIGIAKIGEVNLNNPDGDYNFTIGIRNLGAAITNATAVTFTDVVPAGMTFTNVTWSPEWTCSPNPPLAGGATLTCNYVGSFPIAANQAMGWVTIIATGGNGPYTNCASLDQSDGNSSNNKACVDVQKDKGNVTLVKEIINKTDPAISTSGLQFPVTVTCGSTVTNLNLTDGLPQTIGGVPFGATCKMQEGPRPTPTGLCANGQPPTWAPEVYVPPTQQVQVVSGTTATIKVQNTLACGPTGIGGDAYVLVKKEVISGLQGYTAPATIYRVNVTCDGNTTTLNLSSDGTPQSVGGLAIGTLCTIDEPVPSNNACPTGMTTTWATPTYSPTNKPSAASPGPIVTVTNRFTCKQDGDGGKDSGIQVKKVIAENQSTADLSGISFPVTVTCGGVNTQLPFTNGAVQSIGNLSSGTACSAVETLPPPPTTGCGVKHAYWLPPIYSPPTVSAANGSGPTLTIINKLICERGGFIAVDKKVINNTQADVSNLTFPVQVTCHTGSGNDYVVTLNLTTTGQPQLMHNVVANASCMPVETLPPPPTTGCPQGSTPQWAPIAYSAAPLITVSGTNGLTVTNTLDCVPTKGGMPAALKCPPPKIPVADSKTCICPQGSVERRGKCVVVPTVVVPACVSPAKLNKAGTGCECPRGMDLKGRTCVEKERKPQVRPDDVIRVIPGFGGGGRKDDGDRRGSGGSDRGKGGAVGR